MLSLTALWEAHFAAPDTGAPDLSWRGQGFQSGTQVLSATDWAYCPPSAGEPISLYLLSRLLTGKGGKRAEDSFAGL